MADSRNPVPNFGRLYYTPRAPQVALTSFVQELIISRFKMHDLGSLRARRE